MKKVPSSQSNGIKRQLPVFTLFRDTVFCYDLPQVEKFYSRSRYGSIQERGLFLSFEEAMFLSEKEKISIQDKKDNLFSDEELLRYFVRYDKDFILKYAVFKNLRKKGYIVKTALKFGAAYRVYDKGVKPGEDHSKWLVFPVHERSRYTWFDFASKSRVAHSTKKPLLLGIVDQELDVSYYEVNWKKV